MLGSAEDDEKQEHFPSLGLTPEVRSGRGGLEDRLDSRQLERTSREVHPEDARITIASPTPVPELLFLRCKMA